MPARCTGSAFDPRRAVARPVHTVGCTQAWCTKRATTIRMATSANKKAVTKTKRNLSSLPSRRMGRIPCVPRIIGQSRREGRDRHAQRPQQAARWRRCLGLDARTRGYGDAFGYPPLGGVSVATSAAGCRRHARLRVASVRSLLLPRKLRPRAPDPGFASQALTQSRARSSHCPGFSAGCAGTRLRRKRDNGPLAHSLRRNERASL
jgi:hypothetical protein